MNFFVNFFTKLEEIAKNVDVTIRVKEKNGRYSVLFQPELANSNKLKALNVTGTPKELDENFFGEVHRATIALEGLTSNAQEVIDDADAIKSEKKVDASKKPEKAKGSVKGKEKRKEAKSNKTSSKKASPATPPPSPRDIFSQEPDEKPTANAGEVVEEEPQVQKESEEEETLPENDSESMDEENNE